MSNPQPTIVALPSGAPWEEARAVAETLRMAGHEAWYVGGCVRDLLLARAVKDIDIATDAPPERVEALFPRTVAVGKSFGVIIVVAPSGANIEVATFRHDGAYIDGRRPVGVTYGTARDDVERRDFTVNALLLDPLSGLVFDHVGGLADLRARLLRAVGDAAARLREDRLRVLRGLRFAAALGLEIEPETWRAIVATPLAGLSGERLVQEWFKALGGQHRSAWLVLLTRSGKLRELCPPVAELSEAESERLGRALDAIADDAALPAKAAVWLAPTGPRASAAWLAAMPLQKAFVRQVSWLVERLRALDGFMALPVAQGRRLARDPSAPLLLQAARASAPAAEATTALEAALAREATEPDWKPSIRAADLIELGVRPGPRLGETLARLEDAQLEGRFRSRDEGIALARAMLAEGA